LNVSKLLNPEPICVSASVLSLPSLNFTILEPESIETSPVVAVIITFPVLLDTVQSVSPDIPTSSFDLFKKLEKSMLFV